jgi:hypothetical protein
MTATIEGIPKTQLIAVFRAWRRRLDQCIENEGNYFEERLSPDIICSPFYSWEV